MPQKLFNECIEKLNTKILAQQEALKISEIFIETFPMTDWGKIDWSKIDKKTKVDSQHQIIPALEKLLNSKLDKSVYIEWSEGDLPAIQTDLNAIINNFDNVTSVAFDKFIFNLDEGYVIEILSKGQITVGILS